MSTILPSPSPLVGTSSRFERLPPESGLSLKAASRLFWIAMFIHVVVWTLLPGLLHFGYKPDVIEQLFIGREWVLASSRHPALPAILLELVNFVTGRAFLSPFLTSQLCALVTVWGVWRLARTVLTPISALAASSSWMLYWYFTVESTKYNQNLPYIAFWTLTIVFVFESLRTNKTIYWILAGIFIGLGLFSKFSMILLVVSILVYFVYDAKARQTWRNAGPWLSTLAATLVFIPILIWMLLKQDLVMPEYLSNPDKTSIIIHVWMPSWFLVEQIAIVSFTVIPLLFVLRLPLAKRTDLMEEQGDCRRFLAAIILLPLLFHIAFGLLYLESMNLDYGAPLWPTLGVLILLTFRNRDGDSSNHHRDWRTLCRLGKALVVIELTLIAIFVIQSCFSPYLMDRPRRFHFPMVALGANCERIWAEHVDGPCPFVTGDWWLAGNAAEGMRPSPSVHAIGAFENMDLDDSPTIWSSDEDVNRQGGLILWNPSFYPDELPETLFERFPQAIILPALVIPYERFTNIPPVTIGVAIVKPKNPSQ